VSETGSRIAGFHSLSPQERLDAVTRRSGLGNEGKSHLIEAGSALVELADHLSENVIGTMNVPLGVATNLIVDGEDVLVPMATEESSVIAAVCNAAKQCRDTGGVTATWTGPQMIAQVQILNSPDPEAAKQALLDRRDEIKASCDACDPMLLKLGGGFRDIEVRVLDTRIGPMVILHLIVDTRDAMGANAVNTMAEKLAPHVENWTGGTVKLRILSNLADRRVVTVRGVWRTETIGGEDVRDGMIAASAFADADPYRAATHNKGIMNGISAVVLATGNDTRAIEAGAHAFASRSGRYTALSTWDKTPEGDLEGVMEIPMAVGIVGGATKVHPTAQACLKIMGVTNAERLAKVAAAVGLVQNFSALKALATTGIQAGHMRLHAQNLAITVGAVGEEIEAVAAEIVAKGEIREDAAQAALEQIRSGTGS